MANEFDHIKVKNQLGQPDAMGLFGPFRNSDTVLVEEQPTTIVQYVNDDTAAMWDEAIWDTDVWYDYLAYEKTIYIQNYNNEFIWRFRFADVLIEDNLVKVRSFTDSDASTATEDTTTNYRVDFTAGQVWQSRSCFIDAREDVAHEKVLSASLYVEGTGTYEYYLSANGGIDWEEVLLNTNHTLANAGSDLRVKVVEIGSSTGTITMVKLKYNKTQEE